jgi:charged multivesicular body protein 4
MHLFRRKKNTPQMNAEQSLLTLTSMRNTLTDIEKRQNLLQTKVNSELQNAKEFKRHNNTRNALVCLKRKKMYESEISKLDGARINLEQQIFAIEGASMNKNIFESMRTGHTTMKSLHTNITLEEVDKLKDDMDEQQETLAEFNEALSQPTGIFAAMDEDELLDELNHLEADEVQSQMLEIETPPKTLGTAKETKVPVVNKGADKELEDLYKSLQMT